MAERAGVSFTTVSHVINGTRRVAPETEARVRRAIEELKYHPCARARSLRTGTSGLIGVITTRSDDLYFAEITGGLEDACREAGVGLLLCHTEGDSLLEDESVSMLLSRGVDALVINNFLGGPEAIERLAASGRPIVLLHARFPELEADVVRIDDRDGARKAVSHLIELGHRRIACIAGDALPEHFVHDRYAGYLESLAAAGIEPDDDYFLVGDYSIEGGYECFKDLLSLPKPPTALFFYSDGMAFGALRAAADLGIEVPGEVSIVGFDDISPAGYTVPRLTTIRQPKPELGRTAVTRALERASNRGLSPETRMLGVELIVRESTGPAPEA